MAKAWVRMISGTCGKIDLEDGEKKVSILIGLIRKKTYVFLMEKARHESVTSFPKSPLDWKSSGGDAACQLLPQ